MKNRVLVFPETLSTSVVVKSLYEKEIELERVQKMTSDEKSIFTAASTVRAQVRNMESKMPWPPQTPDFKTENIEPNEYLSMFLNSLQSSERVSRLRRSIGQDLLHAISNGTLCTPKSILFPYMIKTLTNCKELINITNRLGHGVSYSIFEEMETENAYKGLSEMKEDCVLPTKCKEGVFTMMLADNIDRNEQN